MMYLLSAIYQGIRNRRPSGTPYFNFRLGLTSVFWLHFFQFAAVIRYYFHKSLIPGSNVVFVVCLLSLSALAIFLLGIFIPKEVLEESKLDKHIASRANLLFFLYMVLNIFILAFLLAALNPRFKG